ncbi:unnamed protein product [Cylicocyclus nassatus]|uniref:Sushi domain-containing protein n=1 Tax=Cylicocyclus nassatus TaxID=53992 RepID=A0AA36M109_CYLNA|nr:unnamed protein product [Cylicocyclus nassatus]
MSNLTLAVQSSTDVTPAVLNTLYLLFQVFGITSGVDTCSPLLDPIHGYIAYSNIPFINGQYRSGTKARLRCHEGYDPVGTSVSFCYDGSWSSEQFGDCVGQSAETTLPTSSSSAKTSSTSTTEEEITTSSTTASTKKAVTALALGGCPVAGTPTNGSIVYSNGMVFEPVPNGTVATLECDYDNDLQGVESMTCVNGRWEPDEFGHCRYNGSYAKGCPALEVPQNGVLHGSARMVDGKYPINSTLTVTCSNETLLYGVYETVCTENGWDPPELGNCRGKRSPDISDCIDLAPVVGGEIMYDRTAENATAELKCHNSSTNGATKAVCVDGEWNPPTLGNCSIAYESVCPPFAAPNGAFLRYTPNADIVFGTVVDMRCHDGRQNIGNTRSLCDESGWIPPELGSCSRETYYPSICRPYMNRPGGEISYITNVTEDVTLTKAKLICLEGRAALGHRHSTCTARGWVPELGNCSTARGCLSMPDKSDGVILYTSKRRGDYYVNGTNATLECDYADNVEGLAETVCLDGEWSPAPLGNCSTNESVCPLFDVPYGAVLNYFPNIDVAVGTTVGMRCLGRREIGNTHSTCTASGWSPPALGSCSNETDYSLLCPPFTIPAGAKIVYTPDASNITLMSRANLLCTNGAEVIERKCEPLSIIGSGAIYTQPMVDDHFVDGTNVTLKCSDTEMIAGKNCFTMDLPRSGYFSYSNGAIIGDVPHGTLATLMCSDSLVVKRGATTSTCVDGEWIPKTMGTCDIQEQACPLFTAPAGATIHYSPNITDISLWSTANMSCIDGAEVVGESSATCFASGWVPRELGKCPNTTTEVGCTALFTDNSSEIIYSSGIVNGHYAKGTVARLECADTEMVAGAPTVQCINQIWQPAEIGHCLNKTGANCHVLDGPKNGYIDYSKNVTANGDILHGTQATLNCLSPLLVLAGAQTSICNNGKWIPDMLGTCNFDESVCPRFDVPEGANITYDPSETNIGLWAAKLSCISGAEVEGETSATCFVNGWVPSSLGKCPDSTVVCPKFAAIAGAEVRHRHSTTNTSLFSKVTVRCLDGAPVIGNNESVCLSTGWSPPQLGRCANTGTDCGFMPSRSHSKIVYHSGPNLLSEGTNATLTCDESYFIVGTATARCINKTWVPPELGICSPLTGSSCLLLAPPADGQLVYSSDALLGYIPHSVNVSLRCLTGEVVNGTGVSTCVDGSWYPSSVGECEGQPISNISNLCHPLIAPPNGNISLTRGLPDFPAESGVVATLTCLPGKFILGSATSLCVEGKWVPSSLGTCTDDASSGGTETGCPWPATPNGMYLNWSSFDIAGPIHNGTVVSANCVNKASIRGASQMICSNGRWQPAGFGSCNVWPGPTAGLSCPPMNVTSSDMGFIYRYGDQYMTGSVMRDLEHGTILTVKCYNGTMAGNNFTTCADGKWYPPGIGICNH